MILNIAIARKGTGSEPIECQPITKVIECQDGDDVEDIAEAAIFDLAAEHGIENPLWATTTTNSLDNLVKGFTDYFNFTEKRRCAIA